MASHLMLFCRHGVETVSSFCGIAGRKGSITFYSITMKLLMLSIFDYYTTFLSLELPLPFNVPHHPNKPVTPSGGGWPSSPP